MPNRGGIALQPDAVYATALQAMRLPIITIISIAVAFSYKPAAAEEGGKAGKMQVVEVTTAELSKLLKREWDEGDKPTFIDLRNAKEHAKGHLTSSRRLDYTADDFEKTLAKLDRAETFLVYCQDGINSKKSLATWKRLKFKEVYYLKGGWEAYLAHISGAR